jgi:hypothetical protein
VITLSLGPDGSLQAFCEAQGDEDPGHFLDLPLNDPCTLQRVLFQALTRRAARKAKATGQPQEDTSAIVAWLAQNPPSQAPAKASGAKPLMTLDMLKGLKI